MYNIKIKTLVLAGWLIQSAAWSQDATNSVAAPNNNAATNSIADEITAVVMKVNDKLQAGKGTEADLADELKAFDTLLAKHAAEKTDDAAGILYMKAQLYNEVLNLPARAQETFKQLTRDFPNSKFEPEAEAAVAQLEKFVAAEKIRDSLVIGSQFPEFTETNSQGQPLALASFKGKVVLVDFWATWCGPCRILLPDILAAYKKFHADGFEVVGVSLDSDRAALDNFIKQQDGMTWPEFFDEATAQLATKTGEHNVLFQNRLGLQYGVEQLPTSYLLDADGKIIGKDLRGEALSAAVAKALGKN